MRVMLQGLMGGRDTLKGTLEAVERTADTSMMLALQSDAGASQRALAAAGRAMLLSMADLLRTGAVLNTTVRTSLSPDHPTGFVLGANVALVDGASAYLVSLSRGGADHVEAGAAMSRAADAMEREIAAGLQANSAMRATFKAALAAPAGAQGDSPGARETMQGIDAAMAGNPAIFATQSEIASRLRRAGTLHGEDWRAHSAEVARLFMEVDRLEKERDRLVQQVADAATRAVAGPAPPAPPIP
jgi:hypothetical protein